MIFIMRTTQRAALTLIALATAAGAAFSQTVMVAEGYGQAGGSDSAPFVSTRTRAEVQKEAADALAKGEIGQGPITGPQDFAVPSTRSRAEVIAETREAIKNGEILEGPGAGSVTPRRSTQVAGHGAQSAM